MDATLRTNPLLGEHSIWPSRVRGYPKSLIESGLFTSIQSTKLTDASFDVQIAGRYYEASNQLSVRHLRVLIELIDMGKGTQCGDAIEFDLGKLVERLNWSRSGELYTELKRLIRDLADLALSYTEVMPPIEGFSDEPDEYTVSARLFDLFEAPDWVFERGQFEEPEYDCHSKCIFAFSAEFSRIIQNDTLITVHSRVFKDLGRSPLRTYLALFYLGHGHDQRGIFSYSTRKLAERSGLMDRAGITGEKWISRKKLPAFHRALQRVKAAIREISDLRIFRHVRISESCGNSEIYRRNLIVNVARFRMSDESQIMSLPQEFRELYRAHLMRSLSPNPQ